jgi:hypothetical protein
MMVAEAEKLKGELEKKKEQIRREKYFDDVLNEMKMKNYSFAQLLEYVFNLANKHPFDWQWSGFFAQKDLVKKVLRYWTTSSYSRTARALVQDWATGLVSRTVGKESRSITKLGVLQKRKMVVNEDFFLKYSLTNITRSLRTMAPSAFRIFDAFSATKTRSGNQNTEAWRERNEIVSLFNFQIAQILT